jgi:hypothetical protein
MTGTIRICKICLPLKSPYDTIKKTAGCLRTEETVLKTVL